MDKGYFIFFNITAYSQIKRIFSPLSLLPGTVVIVISHVITVHKKAFRPVDTELETMFMHSFYSFK
jgi:hypothetical protein